MPALLLLVHSGGAAAESAALRADIKSDYRARTSRQEIFVESERDAAGPHVLYSLGQLAPDRPVRRAYFEVKAFLDTASRTDYGVLGTSLGIKAQMENPPRRPNDPLNEFNRTGRRTRFERAAIRFRGFSVGLLPSFFNFEPTLGYSTPYATEQIAGLVAYSHKARALEFTLALEEQKRRRLTESAWGEYRSERAIDVVGAARGAFPWGAVHLAAAAHPVKAAATADCCGTVTGRGTGWAVGAGYEHWFEVGNLSDGVVLNVSGSRGALDYLGATDYPADFALSRDGSVSLTEGWAYVASYSRNWTREFRTVLTVSQFGTALDSPSFEWKTRGRLLQAVLEYAPLKSIRYGVEVSYHQDRVGGGDRGAQAPPVGNSYTSGLVFVRLRY